jgi:hypothetical protein
MTLVLDERAALQGQPRLHVFIAGVSYYTHLPGGDPQQKAAKAYGMQQLSSTALTAYKVYRWLVEHGDQLPLPLATVRLLLSPAQAELDAEPGMVGLADRCTRRNFAVEAHGWRTDASLSNDDMTLFYFAGHGVQRQKDDAVMLLENFADPFDGPLTNAVAIENFFNGMAPPTDPAQKVARKQLYFLDSCRIAPGEFRASEWMNVPDLWAPDRNGPDNRLASLFFAAIPGTKAYALRLQQSVFSLALFKCLEGSGGEPMEEDEQGQVRWRVNVYSLARGLDAELKKLNEQLRCEQSYEPGRRFNDITVSYLKAPPSVSVSFEIDPADALPYIAVEVMNHENNAVWSLPPPVDPNPYVGDLPAGVYSFRARVAQNPGAPAPSLTDFVRNRQIIPPQVTLKARVV